MRHVRMLCLCLIAVFAITAVASATASASAPNPEYMSCVKKKGGHYTSKECTAASKVEAGGKYELQAVPEGTPFTSKSKSATFTLNGKVIKCKKDTDAGELEGENLEYVTITFDDCAVNGNKKEPCETEGAGTGTIRTDELFGELHYVNAGETEIGLVLAGIEGPFAAFRCGAEAFELGGHLIGVVENTSKGQAVTFAVNGKGEQEHEAYWWSGGLERANQRLSSAGGEATLVTVDEQGPKGVGAHT